MKIENYHPPKSSFLSVNKDMRLLVDKILSNQRLKKLLYYQVKDPLSKPNLTEKETLSLFGNQIKMVPKLYVDGELLTYMIISFDNFIESANPQFRDNVIEFDIICHFESWQLEDFDLRPYRIAAELDSMLDKQKLTGIGLLEFLGASQIVLNSEYAGLCLMYRAYHGGEDKKALPNPADQQQFNQDFSEMIDTQEEIKAEEYPDGLQASLINRK